MWRRSANLLTKGHSGVEGNVIAGISAPATLADSPAEFHAHRRSFTDPAPARRGASVNFSTCTLRSQTLPTAANLLNSQEDFLNPFRHTPALRRVGILIGSGILTQNPQNSADHRELWAFSVRTGTESK